MKPSIIGKLMCAVVQRSVTVSRMTLINSSHNHDRLFENSWIRTKPLSRDGMKYIILHIKNLPSLQHEAYITLCSNLAPLCGNYAQHHASAQALWLWAYQRHCPDTHPLLCRLSIRKLKVSLQCDLEKSICAPHTKQQRQKQAVRAYGRIEGIYGKCK